MKEITFKYFAKHHLWLLLAVILIPVLGIGIYCGLFWRCIDESIVATIVMGVISYIGTVAWGLFIYYKSWLDKKMQEYRDRPRVGIKYLPKANGKAFYNSQDEEIKKLLGLFSFMNINNCFLRVKFTNYGIHTIHDIYHTSTTILIDDKEIEESTLNYIDVTEGKALGFKETYERYIGIKNSNLPIDKPITLKIKSVFQFTDSLTNTYNLETTIDIRDGFLSLPTTRVYRKESL